MEKSSIYDLIAKSQQRLGVLQRPSDFGYSLGQSIIKNGKSARHPPFARPAAHDALKGSNTRVSS
jgi:hypothetical protein